MDFSFSDLNFNSVENLPGFEARAAFTVPILTEMDSEEEFFPFGRSRFAATRHIVEECYNLQLIERM